MTTYLKLPHKRYQWYRWEFPTFDALWAELERFGSRLVEVCAWGQLTPSKAYEYYAGLQKPAGSPPVAVRTRYFNANSLTPEQVRNILSKRLVLTSISGWELVWPAKDGLPPAVGHDGERGFLPPRKR
jgi:hypothetical protein